MNASLRFLMVTSALLSAGCTSLAANEVASSPIEVTIEMVDGSRIVGTVAPQTVTFNCASAGTISAPLAALSSIERHYGWQTYRFTFRNGDVFHGVPARGSLEVDASFGKAVIPVFQIARAEVAHPPLAAFPILFTDPGEALEWTGYQNVTIPRIVDGALTFECAGRGYLHRANLKIPALSCPVLVVRMKTSAGTMGLVYWMTDTQPGFVDSAFLSFKTIPDGRFHDYAIPVGTHPFWRGTITALRIDCGVDAGAEKSLVAFESLSAAPDGELFPETVRPVPSFSVFDGKPFQPMPAWVTDGAANDFLHTTEPEFGYFFVRDADASMKWFKGFPMPIEPNAYSEIDIEYQAWSLVDDGGYVVWLFDAESGQSSGFEAIAPKDIIPDGETHTLRIPLSRFDCSAPITGCAVRVRSGPTGWGFVFFHKFRFVRAVPSPPSGAPPPDVPAD